MVKVTVILSASAVKLGMRRPRVHPAYSDEVEHHFGINPNAAPIASWRCEDHSVVVVFSLFAASA
jgi:hypothetical protein